MGEERRKEEGSGMREIGRVRGFLVVVRSRDKLPGAVLAMAL